MFSGQSIKKQYDNNRKALWKKGFFSLLGSVGIKSLKFFFATDDIAACFLAVVTLKMAPAFVF